MTKASSFWPTRQTISPGGLRHEHAAHLRPARRDSPQWKFDGATEIQFNWEYDDGSAPLLELYEKGKQQQWDASTRLDWSLELNPDNPMELKDEAISIYGTDYWNKMTDKERAGCAFICRPTRSRSSCMASRAR